MEHRPQPADHEYVFSIVGRCVRCQRLEAEHVKMLPQPDPMTECAVDHDSINGSLLIGNGGYERTRCPMCNVMVEPRSITGDGPTGRPYDAGRGDLTTRLRKRLNGLAGWWAWNGGDQ